MSSNELGIGSTTGEGTGSFSLLVALLAPGSALDNGCDYLEEAEALEVRVWLEPPKRVLKPIASGLFLR